MGSMIHMRRLHLSRSCASFPDSPFSDKYFLMMSNQHGFDLPLLLFSGASTILSALSSLPMTWYRTDLTTCRAHFPLDCQANSAVTWYPRYTLSCFHPDCLPCVISASTSPLSANFDPTYLNVFTLSNGGVCSTSIL